MIRTQIQLTEEQARRVKMLARRANISMAEVIRQAVDEWLEHHATRNNAERWQQSLNAIGKFHSGISDIAECHDEYLAESYTSFPD